MESVASDPQADARREAAGRVRPPKRLRDIVTAAEAAGWTYDVTSHGHPSLKPPSGLRDPYHPERLQGPVMFAATPSDWRGDLNSRAALRRAGVDI